MKIRLPNCRSEKGATHTEYSTLVGMVAVVAIAVVVIFGNEVADIYCNNNGHLNEMGHGDEYEWGYDPEQKCCASYVEELGGGGWQCV